MIEYNQANNERTVDQDQTVERVDPPPTTVNPDPTQIVDRVDLNQIVDKTNSNTIINMEELLELRPDQPHIQERVETSALTNYELILHGMRDPSTLGESLAQRRTQATTDGARTTYVPHQAPRRVMAQPLDDEESDDDHYIFNMGEPKPKPNQTILQPDRHNTPDWEYVNKYLSGYHFIEKKKE